MAATGNPSSSVPAETIVGVAKLIGIDPVNEPQYLWIAEEAAKAELPEAWKELLNEDNETVYYNSRTKNLQKLHPLVERFAQLYHKQKSFTKMVSQAPSSEFDSVEAKMAVIIPECMSRVQKNLPVATPEIIEKLAVLLKVDTTDEFFLIRCLKQSLEAYVEKRFHLGTLVQDMMEPLDFLRRIRKQQVKVDIIRKPDSIVMCQECEAKSAVVKCEQCKDFFCQDCFNATHATGKRRGHITADVEQLVCAAYDDRVATCQCIQCGLFYSDQGFSDIHASRPELHNHLKRVINGLVCLECEHFNASVLCEDCVDLFCTECFIKLHRKGKRRQHVHLTIDNTGQIFRGGFLVPPEEAQVLTDRARTTTEGGAWLPFHDDNLNTYWYHLVDKITTRQSPYDNESGFGGEGGGFGG